MDLEFDPDRCCYQLDGGDDEDGWNRSEDRMTFKEESGIAKCDMWLESLILDVEWKTSLELGINSSNQFKEALIILRVDVWLKGYRENVPIDKVIKAATDQDGLIAEIVDEMLDWMSTESFYSFKGTSSSSFSCLFLIVATAK